MNVEQIKELWMGGDGAVSIAKRLGLKCHPITITRLAKKNKWVRQSKQQKSAEKLLHKSDDIIGLFKSGVQASEIARKLGIEPYSVLRLLRRKGYTPKSLHYAFNEREDIRKRRAESGRRLWDNGKLDVTRMLTPAARQKSVESGKQRWQDPQYKEKMSCIARKKWYENRMWEKMKKFKETKPENAVADILSLMKIRFSRNFRINEFSVDFYCPDHNLMLDIDGEYWHGRFDNHHKQVAYVKEKDMKKNNYMKSRPERYIRLWEQYTLSRESLTTILGRIFNVSIDRIDFNFKELDIKNINQSEAKNFVEKYHYTMTLGPFCKGFGVFLGDILILICVFKYPTYNTNNGSLELSRFCVHPVYQKPNLASFCLSRILKELDANEIITYADQTQGHTGTLYKAANFEEVGQTSPSYYYIDEYNSKYHKKVIYNHATKMKMTEKEYVEKVGLRKVPEQPKIKFRFTKR